MTCSPGAAAQLTEIARTVEDDELIDIEDSIAHRCPCLSHAARALRNYCGRDSAVSCMSNSRFGLSFGPDHRGKHQFQWAFLSAPDPYVWPPWLSDTFFSEFPGDASGPKVTQSKVLSEVLPGKATPAFLSRILRLPSGSNRDAGRVLEKAPSLPSNYPSHCLLVFRDWRYSGGEL